MNKEEGRFEYYKGMLERARNNGGQVWTRENLINYYKIPVEFVDRIMQELDFVREYVKNNEGEIKLNPSRQMFFDIKNILKKYIDTSEMNYNLLSVWCLGTYFHSQFETFPLLTLMARKQSGKTRTLKLLSSLSCGSDGSVSTSITETHLFRRPSGAVFFDEMESLGSKEKGALRETMNAIYKRGNKIIRYTEKRTNEGKQYVEEAFYPYYPLGIANIYGFGDVLADRSLQLILQRSKRNQTKLIEDFTTNTEIIKIKEKLSRLRAEIPQGVFSEWNSYVEEKEYAEELESLFNKISETKLHGRPLEIFFPLFLIGDIFGVLDLIMKSSHEYIERLQADLRKNPDDQLQEFIEKKGYEGFVFLSSILKDFKESIENAEDWMNAKWLGNALRRLDLVSQRRLLNGKTQVLLSISKSTNTTNPIISITSTTSTKKVEKVEDVDLVGQKGPYTMSTFTQQELEKTGLAKEYLKLIGDDQK